MIVGYARTSTTDQIAGYEAQKAALQAANCEKVFSEQVSSVAVRDELQRCLEFVREGDVLIVTKLDRLARSVPHLLEIVDLLDRKKVGLIIQSMGGQQVDSRCPTGKLMLTLLGAIATFERELMLERQREGIAKAKGEGKYKGRKATAQAKAADILELANTRMTREAIAAQVGVGVASVYRIIAEHKAGAAD